MLLNDDDDAWVCVKLVTVVLKVMKAMEADGGVEMFDEDGAGCVKRGDGGDGE